MSKKDQDTHTIHLVNKNYHNNETGDWIEPIINITLSFFKPEWNYEKIYLLNAETENYTELDYTRSNGTTNLNLPELTDWSLILFEAESQLSVIDMNLTSKGNETVQVSAIIKNQGITPVSQKIKLQKDGTQTDELDIWLKPQEEYEYHKEFNASIGTHKITLGETSSEIINEPEKIAPENEETSNTDRIPGFNPTTLFFGYLALIAFLRIIKHNK